MKKILRKIKNKIQSAYSYITDFIAFKKAKRDDRRGYNRPGAVSISYDGPLSADAERWLKDQYNKNNNL